MVADGMGELRNGKDRLRMATRRSVREMLEDSETTWPGGYVHAETQLARGNALQRRSGTTNARGSYAKCREPALCAA
jgi:hypothetical protein